MTPAQAQRHRRRLTNTIKADLRQLSLRLSQFTRQVGVNLDLAAADLEVFALINEHGPLSPSELARRAGKRPATMTGVLDRLERGGWVVRERDTDARDRRTITVRALRDRNPELFGQLAGMNAAMDEIFAGYSSDELKLLADFIRRTADAGRAATDELASG